MTRFILSSKMEKSTAGLVTSAMLVYRFEELEATSPAVSKCHGVIDHEVVFCIPFYSRQLSIDEV